MDVGGGGGRGRLAPRRSAIASLSVPTRQKTFLSPSVPKPQGLKPSTWGRALMGCFGEILWVYQPRSV